MNGLLPLNGGASFYKMYYGLLESKLFIISTKYISLERSESQDSIFGDFVMEVILREKKYTFVTEKIALKNI